MHTREEVGTHLLRGHPGNAFGSLVPSELRPSRLERGHFILRDVESAVGEAPDRPLFPRRPAFWSCESRDRAVVALAPTTVAILSRVV